MQLNAPLTPALSPSDGEREKKSRAADQPLNDGSASGGRSFSLSLAEYVLSVRSADKNVCATGQDALGRYELLDAGSLDFRCESGRMISGVAMGERAQGGGLGQSSVLP